MRQTWRWFGPKDRTSIDAILQAGAEGVVTALHHIPTGEVWPNTEIIRRQEEISLMTNGSPSGLLWEAVESLPVSESIKKQTGPWREHLKNYKESLKNIGSQGIKVVCYNFMPLLDWTRTDLSWRLAHGGTTMRFDLVDFAAFDLHILCRQGAEDDYSKELVSECKKRFQQLNKQQITRITESVACGLPGETEKLTVESLRHYLTEFNQMTAEKLRANFIVFLEEVVPVAEKVGIRLCCHPDDPPFPLLGLPRIMSTEDHFKTILTSVDSPANGMTLCSGSLGARPDNDLPGMIDRLGDRLHFLHLRNVKRETPGLVASFHEAEHLEGDTDMVALISSVLREENRRKAEGRNDWNIPVRPDHGQDILDDLGRKGQPGYPSIGRLKGLAELRGILTALTHPSMLKG